MILLVVEYLIMFKKETKCLLLIPQIPTIYYPSVTIYS